MRGVDVIERVNGILNIECKKCGKCKGQQMKDLALNSFFHHPNNVMERRLGRMNKLHPPSSPHYHKK